MANGKSRRCNRCRKMRFLYDGESFCARCQVIKSRQTNGKCVAAYWHGPGHQTDTYCMEREAKHPMLSGKKLHRTLVNGDVVEWFGVKKFSGYFDEPPTSPAERITQ